MKPIKFSLRYPAVTLILTAMVVMVGIHAFLKMQRTEDPTITIRTGLVAAMYPGATSEQVEKQVTKTLEKHIFKFPGGAEGKDLFHEPSRRGHHQRGTGGQRQELRRLLGQAAPRVERGEEHRTPRRRHGAGGGLRFRRYRRHAGRRPWQAVRISRAAGLCGQDPRRDAHRPRGGETRHLRKAIGRNPGSPAAWKGCRSILPIRARWRSPESSETSSRAEGISRPTGRRSP